MTIDLKLTPEMERALIRVINSRMGISDRIISTVRTVLLEVDFAETSSTPEERKQLIAVC